MTIKDIIGFILGKLSDEMLAKLDCGLSSEVAVIYHEPWPIQIRTFGGVI